MKLLEYLDRVGERRARRPSRPLDTRLIVGFSFLAGYYALIFYIADRTLPAQNAELVKDALLILGPAVGVIVGALFRSDARDIEQTSNTGRAFEAITATASAASSTPALAVDPKAQVDTKRNPDGSTTQIVTDVPDKGPWERG